MTSTSDIEIWAGIWLVAACVLIVRHWRADRGVGLLFTYVVSFGLIHLLAPVMNLLPWYERGDLALITEGLKQSTYAMLAFAVGVEVAWSLLHRRGEAGSARTERIPVDPRMVVLYLLAGAFLYAVVFPVAGRIPSVAALAAAGSTLIVAAVGLKCWNAWQAARQPQIWCWLLASTSLPLITVITQGFLGYGFAAMLTIFAFVASFYRPRWKVVAFSLMLGYFGLSIYVTYMRDRNDIRAVVWTGGSLRERADRLYETVANIERFDPYDAQHLIRIDQRLNQDYLVGAAVAFLEASPAAFARGETISDAALAVVPRALWENKPIVSGSGDLVSTFTGIRFAEGTSVGIGQVMECYVNFGTPGVLVGFLMIGALIVTVEHKSRAALNRHDVRAFAYWFMPGLSLLQVGGSFVDVTGSAAAALVIAFLVHRISPLVMPEREPRWSSPAADAVEISGP